jgi:predicted homoserine dehydrogenase-like protein
LTDLLSRLSSLQKPIAVGIIGAGAMGRGLYYQTTLTPGMTCVALADIDLQRAISCMEATGQRFEIAETTEQVARAIEHQAVCVCSDGASAIEEAGRFAEQAILHHKHLVLMNAEIDLIFGPYLAALAEENSVTYTSCDGDQHGVIKRLWDETKLWGIEPVLAGAFTDGTKLGVEMALVANALGLRVDVPGMHGPKASHVREALTLFDLEACTNRGGVVDYLLGAEPGGGVFVIGHCEEAYQRRMLAYYKMGSGPFYIFYRPYHLCHIEAMRSIAEACLDGVSLLKPDFGFQANVYAYAKRDLREGERLDGIGGYMCYGLVENARESELNHGLPICLADGALLQRRVSKDEKILLEDVEFSRNGDAWRLYSLALRHGGATSE